MRKKIIIVFTICSILLTGCACGSDSPRIDIEETTTEADSSSEVGDNSQQTDIDEVIEDYTVTNNGGTVVKCGNDVYYWKYNENSYEKQAVLADYAQLHTGQNKLVCQSKDGSEDVLVTTSGTGNIYIVENTLYFEKLLSNGGREICFISRTNGKWDTATVKTLCKGCIYAADDEKGKLILSKEGILTVLDVVSGEFTNIDINTNGTFIMYHDGKVYYQGVATTYYNAQHGEMLLYVADLKGNKELLTITSADLYDYTDGGEVAVQCMQIHNEYIYYSYGSYAGTANYYQGGNICRMSMDGKENEVLVTEAAGEFYVYDTGNQTKLICSAAYEDISEISVKSIGVEDKTKLKSDMKLGSLGEPFYTSDKSYWIYMDVTGECTSLITKADYVNESSMRADIKDVEVIDNEVYYTVVYSKYNEAVSVGWRDGYDWVKTVVYKKDLNSGKVSTVYTYQDEVAGNNATEQETTTKKTAQQSTTNKVTEKETTTKKPDITVEPTTTKKQEETTTASNAKVLYTVNVKTAGGMALEDIDVYIYADSTKKDLKEYRSTDKSGTVKFELKKSPKYAIVLEGVPAGYNVRASYSFVGNTANIILTSSVITGELPIGLNVGDVMYDMSISTSDGTRYTLSEILKEKDMVMINFWYSTGIYCVEDFPYIEAVYQQYKGDVEILALSPFDSDSAIQDFKNQYQLSFPMAGCAATYVNKFNLTAYPTSIIIDRYGVICMIETGSFSSLETLNKVYEHFTGDNYSQKLLYDGIEDLD